MGVPSSDRKVLLSPGQRVLYVGLGAVVVLGGASLAALLFHEARWATRPGAQPLVLSGFGALFALVAVWGALLIGWGARGFRMLSERALRHDRTARRLSGLLDFFVLPLGALALFLLSHGRPWSSLSFSGLLTLGWYICVAGLWLPLAVAIHELGHVAVGVGLGFTWSALRTGPLEILRTEARPRVRWNTEGLEFFRGLARFAPAQVLEQPRRFAWVLLGGPGANLLAGLLHGVAARALGGPMPLEAQGLPALLWAGALCHVFLGLSNLVPRRLATAVSDGAMWLELRRARPRVDAPLLVQVQSEFITRRPREWSPSVEALREAAAAANTEPETAATLRLYALAMLLDRGEVSAARTLLGSLGPELAPSPSLRREFLLQHALVHALALADPPRARALFMKAGQQDGGQPIYSRLVEAAVLLSEGHRIAAREALGEWERTAVSLGCREEWIIGNMWALERVHEALGLVEPPSQD